MDADTLGQVEKIITTAVSGVEGRLREDMQALGTSLRQEFGEKTDALGASIRHEFGSGIQALRTEFGEKTDGLAASLRQEFGSGIQALRTEFGDKTDGLAASLRQEFGEKFDEAKRHRGVLYEDVLHRIDLVVEGHQTLFQKIENVEARLEAKIDHEALETRSLLQLSYRQLQERVETLEQRVQLIEKRLGLAN